MSMLLPIVTNTPLWVWPLLLLVLWLGWYGLRPRVMRPQRLAILPLVSVGMSAASIAQSPQPILSLIAWMVAAGAALPIGYALGSRRAVRPHADGRFEIAGGWFSLCFGVSIFVVRYAQGVLLGFMPALRAEPAWIGLSAAIGGMVAGIGIGWLVNLTRRGGRLARAVG
ncbi:MAG: DUF6622 family protein [Reyranellaceae bacterium]